MAVDEMTYDDTIPTPTDPDEDLDPYRVVSGDHAKDETVHSLDAVDEQGQALRTDGTVAPDKDEEKWPAGE